MTTNYVQPTRLGLSDEERQQLVAVVKAVAAATRSLGERTTPAIAQRLRWDMSDVARIVGVSHAQKFIRRGRGGFELTAEGWALIEQQTPHMEKVA